MDEPSSDEEYICHVKVDAEKGRVLLACVSAMFLATAVFAFCVGYSFVAMFTLEIACLAAGVAGFNHFVLSAPVESAMLNRYAYGRLVHPVACIVVCIVCVQMEGPSNRIGARSLFHFLPPVALTREVSNLASSKPIQAWCIWISLHFIASVVYAACGDADEWQLLITLLLVDIGCFATATDKMQYVQRYKKNAQKSKMDVNATLSRICDAVVTLDYKWEVLDSPDLPRFAAMLGRTPRSMRGRNLSDFIHWEDSENFSAHVNDALQASLNEGKEATSIMVRLSDAYATPVAVNIFHVRHAITTNCVESVTYSVGVCEAWQQKKGRPSKRDARGRRAQAEPPEIGFLQPLESRSLNDAKDARARSDSPRPRSTSASFRADKLVAAASPKSLLHARKQRPEASAFLD